MLLKILKKNRDYMRLYLRHIFFKLMISNNFLNFNLIYIPQSCE